jgi:site-specific recombinase XerC
VTQRVAVGPRRPKTDARITSVGEITVLLPSWRLHLKASNLSPRTIRAYTDDGALLAAFPADKGMPTAARSIRCEHVEAFIVAELERTAAASAATRYRSLQQFFNWLDEEGEIDASPMTKMRPPRTACTTRGWPSSSPGSY